MAWTIRADAAYAQLLENVIERRMPDEVSALLSPHYRITLPEGEGPFPTALLASGCDGPKDNLDRWSEALRDAGWASVVVDSHTPRGFDDYQIWRLVCIGQLLPGPQRAGDLAVALRDVAAMPFADSERLVLMGASHGGWAILDALALRAEDRLPYGLTAWPDGPAPEEIAGAVVFYPYCGALSRVGKTGWTADVPVLFVLVEDDSIVDEDDCLEVIDEMRGRGRPVEAIVVRGVTHGFDQQEKNALSSLEFSETATAAALAGVRRFLDGL